MAVSISRLGSEMSLRRSWSPALLYFPMRCTWGSMPAFSSTPGPTTAHTAPQHQIQQDQRAAIFPGLGLCCCCWFFFFFFPSFSFFPSLFFFLVPGVSCRSVCHDWVPQIPLSRCPSPLGLLVLFLQKAPPLTCLCYKTPRLTSQEGALHGQAPWRDVGGGRDVNFVKGTRQVSLKLPHHLHVRHRRLACREDKHER